MLQRSISLPEIPTTQNNSPIVVESTDISILCVRQTSSQAINIPSFDEIDGIKFKAIKLRIKTPFGGGGIGVQKEGKDRNINIEAEAFGFGAEFEFKVEKTSKKEKDVKDPTISQTPEKPSRPKLVRQNCICE